MLDMLVTFEVLSGVRSTLFSFLQLKNIFSMLVQSEMSSPERSTSSKPEQLANMPDWFHILVINFLRFDAKIIKIL